MKNLLTKLSKKLQNGLRDYGVSFVGVDEYNELVCRSDYDMDISWYQAIEEELRVLGYEVE